MPSGYQLDFTGPVHLTSVRGIRVWRNSSVPLYGDWAMGMEHRWGPGENQALCLPEYGCSCRLCRKTDPFLEDPHRPADPRCQCGFYAYFYPEDVLSRLQNMSRPIISGVIEGYGQVSIGTKGFRCEKARILAVTAAHIDRVINTEEGLTTLKVDIMFQSAPSLGERLGVPSFPSLDTMVAEFPPTDPTQFHAR